VHDRSITHALREQFGECPVIQVTRSGTAQPHPDEAVLLGLRFGRQVFAREVRISAGDRVRVIARTITPLEPRSESLAILRELGPRSLGSVLFGRRRASGPTRLDAGYAPVSGTADWARRTRWRIRNSVLLVTEIFQTQADEQGRRKRYTPGRFQPDRRRS
jgi:chorismate lyase